MQEKHRDIQWYCSDGKNGIYNHYSFFICEFEEDNVYDRFEECLTSRDSKYHVINFIHFNKNIKDYSDIGFYPHGFGEDLSQDYEMIEDIDKIFRCANIDDWEVEVKEYYQNHQLLE